MKIFLVGYMGSGKTTAGRHLARHMKLGFIDMDSEIEREAGKNIEDIFANEGEDYFRRIEHEYLKKVILDDDIVISTGGGTPCFLDNMDIMNNSGGSVYFRMSVETLVSRLIKAKNKRPLIKDLNEIDLRYFIASNLEKREPFYNKAHYIVNALDFKVSGLAEMLITHRDNNQIR